MDKSLWEYFLFTYFYEIFLFWCKEVGIQISSAECFRLNLSIKNKILIAPLFDWKYKSSLAYRRQTKFVKSSCYRANQDFLHTLNLYELNPGCLILLQFIEWKFKKTMNKLSNYPSKILSTHWHFVGAYLSISTKCLHNSFCTCKFEIWF